MDDDMYFYDLLERVRELHLIKGLMVNGSSSSFFKANRGLPG